MTIRRTEIPAGGKSRPHKPDLDEMHGIEEVPLSKSRPHAPSTRETHENDFVPFAPEEGRPKPRSIGGRPGSHVGKKGRR